MLHKDIFTANQEKHLATTGTSDASGNARELSTADLENSGTDRNVTGSHVCALGFTGMRKGQTDRENWDSVVAQGDGVVACR